MARHRDGLMAAAISIADMVSWSCALALIVFLLVSSLRSASVANSSSSSSSSSSSELDVVRGGRFGERPCDEIYVVGEGETLHTISDKCGDPYIVEENPHIHDPDDVFPGLVIKITPTKLR
ncbi:uncharacterized protein [Typha angustifolia]|uniref:uncharacterized protein n=1 Tax=Typha angustifolia TaxID=59011 RepID=UPI003C2B8B36